MPDDQARNMEFAAYVDEVAEGRSNRELSRVTRDAGFYVNPTSIGDMRWGIVPSFRLLDRLAKGLDLDAAKRQALLRKARFEADPQTAVGTVLDHASELTYDPDLEGIDVRGYHGAEHLSERSIEQINQALRALLTEDRKRQGRD